jgi:hypothetical protein
MVQKVRNYRQAYWWPRCGAHARSTNAPCQRKVERDEHGRPKARCWNHGSAPGSGKQTERGRRNIAEATGKRMKAFWSDWKAKGSPAISRGYRIGRATETRATGHAKAKASRSPQALRQRVAEGDWGDEIGYAYRVWVSVASKRTVPTVLINKRIFRFVVPTKVRHTK